jgi:uncharacterized protein YecE (DUF72 family)
MWPNIMDNARNITALNTQGTKPFLFRNLDPKVLLGTASDRYEGWLGQIYSREKWKGKIKGRTKRIGGKSFVEKTLPVESVKEYFEHFPVLEIDYTFYSPLRDRKGKPTRTFHTLKQYQQYMNQNDRVILKVPRAVSARRMHRGGQYLQNETYLDPKIFVEGFLEPAMEILGVNLKGMIFEQEYQRKQDRVPVKRMAQDLDGFFAAIPQDTRYHMELRTEAYLSFPVFKVLEKHGVGQVLSHWTWLPPLSKQLARAGNRIFNSGRARIIRLMTPRGVRYEDAYARAHPFDRLLPEMLQPEMVAETVGLMGKAVEERLETSILINNRTGGNAPLIAQRIAEQFIESRQHVHP